LYLSKGVKTMPENRGDVWIEEYANALNAFNIAVDRLRVAVDNIYSENRILKVKLTEQEKREDRKFTLEWMKENDSN